jgi:hypothetical protein
MGIYQVSVYVDYTYEVEADSYDEAIAQAADYKNHLHTADIFNSSVLHISDGDEE